MPSTLTSPSVARVLARLLAQAEQQDPLAKQRVKAREAELGSRLAQAQRYELYGDAPLAITREVGELLYVLAVGRRARGIVEFGSSLGISTIFLAAAVRDGDGAAGSDGDGAAGSDGDGAAGSDGDGAAGSDGDGAGSLITTELHPGKVAATRRHLTEAGLADLVELRAGDALQTLTQLDRPVDLLFLDGRNDLYLPVLRLVEPRLAPDALVAADLNSEDPDLLPYLAYVRDPSHGYFSIEIPLDAGVELSARIPS